MLNLDKGNIPLFWDIPLFLTSLVRGSTANVNWLFNLQSIKVQVWDQKNDYGKKPWPRTLAVWIKVLAVLLCDSNKILMQWNGPFSIMKVVSRNDYGVNINVKMKTYDIIMQKSYSKWETNDKEVTASTLFDI